MLKKIESICNSFLWNGAAVGSKKPCVSWKRVCQDLKSGGLAIKSFVTWNYAAILKQLCAPQFKKERLWVKWIHAYYVRGRDLLSCHFPNDVSWILRKVMGMRLVLVDLGGWEDVATKGHFSIDRAYQCLSRPQQRVPWSNLMCNNPAGMRSKFVVWLYNSQRLVTLDRLHKWGLAVNTDCRLCENGMDSHHHQFL